MLFPQGTDKKRKGRDMKNIKSLLMLAAITVASMTFVSCDDDPWYDGCWHDPYDWSYNYGDWNWNNDY